MTASELKKSILQMAVEGKLTKQSKKDEPVEKLLKRIKEEKDNLIKEGRIKREKTTSEIYKKDGSYYERIAEGKNILKEVCIDEELPFEIPDSWVWVRLGNISKIISKGTTPQGGNNSYLKSGVGFIRVENISKDGFINLDNMKFIDFETHSNFLKRSILEENDLLISIAGALGRTAIITKEYLPLNINQAISFFRCINIDDINIMYIQKCIDSIKIQKYLLSQTKVTAIPNLTLEIIQKCLIPLPPIEEQERIVDKINLLMPLINEYDSLEKNITKLNKEFPNSIKKSILQYAIEGKLTEQSEKDEPVEKLLKRIKEEREKLIKEGKIKKDKTTSEIYKKDGSYYERITDGKNILKDICIDDELPFEIPDSWSFVRLVNICKLMDGEKRSNEKHVIMDARFLRGKGDGILSNSGKYVSAGTYLILVDGENSGEVFISKEDGYMGSTFKILNMPLCLNEYYILYFLELHKLVLKKSKKGVAIPHLNKELFFNLLLPLPPIDEQGRIVHKINRLNEIINTIKL